MAMLLEGCSRGGRSACGRFFLAQVFVEQEGAEREDRSDECLDGKPVVPLVGAAELGQSGGIEQKQ